MTEQEWLKKREETIGSTDSAIILGLSPYKSVYELYAEKSGLVKPDPTIGEKPAVIRGKKLEPLVRALFSATVEPVVYEENAIIINETVKYISFSPDGIIGTYDKPRAILEIKTGAIFGWTKSLIPVYYYAQCQHQLLVTPSAEFVHLCALVFGESGVVRDGTIETYGKYRKSSSNMFFRMFKIYPDKKLHAVMLNRYATFKFALEMKDISYLNKIADPIDIAEYVDLVP